MLRLLSLIVYSIPGATVRIGDRAGITFCGSYSFSRVTIGESFVSVAVPGCRSTNCSLSVKQDSETIINIRLERLGDDGSYDLIIVGAGTGGVSAAIQAVRMGVRVALVEETDWIGGQMTAAGVTSLDEGPFIPANRSGIYLEFVERIRKYYSNRGKSTNTAYYSEHSIAFEPSVGQKILYQMLPLGGSPAGPSLDLYLCSTGSKVLSSGNVLTGVTLANGMCLTGTVTIDATEYGDLIPLTSTRYRVGNSTRGTVDNSANLNPITWTAVIRKYPNGMNSELLMNVPPPVMMQL